MSAGLDKIVTEGRPAHARLARARALYAMGEDAAAMAAYLDLLKEDPTHFSALNELGTLALATGHRSAAHTAYEQAVRSHPDNPLARVNLANLLLEDEDLAGARLHYEAALAADNAVVDAHRGLARVLAALGDDTAAEPHWRTGFAGADAVAPQRGRGLGQHIPLLLLVSARGGNVPTQRFLDDTTFAVTVVYTDFFDTTQPLPPHAIVFNAVGDADFCPAALEQAGKIAALATAPVINPPARIRPTTRAAVAGTLAKIPGVVAPAIRSVSRADLLNPRGLRYPVLLRAPGFHTGRHFVRVDNAEALSSALARLPGDPLLAIDYLNARGRDGFARKYRVMFIDGGLYPLHLAVSADWKVHYFTADMATNADHREEERRFLEDMDGALGDRAMIALTEIARTLALDYGGIDFGLSDDGSLLLFEANATMVINLPDSNPIWDYRRAPIKRALDAARAMVARRGCCLAGGQRVGSPAG